MTIKEKVKSELQTVEKATGNTSTTFAKNVSQFIDIKENVESCDCICPEEL